MPDISDSNQTLADVIGAASSFLEAGKYAEAVGVYNSWIERNPDDPLLYVAYYNRATFEGDRKDADAAISSLRQAIALKNDFMPAFINLGSQLERSGRAGDALEMWRSIVNHAVLINGQNIFYVMTGLKQMARVMLDHDLLQPAEEALALALGIKPERQAVEHYLGARFSQCKWPAIVPAEYISRSDLVGQMAPLSAAVYADDPMFHLANADRYADTLTRGITRDPLVDRRHAAIDFPERRLRVGYVSSDLRDHAIGYLMAEFFELHGHNDIEVFVYYCGIPSDSMLTNRIKGAVEHWCDIREMSDAAAARKISEDGIDILVDVNGYTRDARTAIFAHRPAPLQVNWLGYPGSMGTPYHHYIVADDWIIPPGAEMYYSEQVIRLPCYQPNDRKRTVGTCPTRVAAGLPEKGVVYCCFNGSQKIQRATFDRWLEILHRVPDSVLWLLAPDQDTQKRLRDYAEGNGVSPGRIVFAPKVYNPDHLARYALADVILDTFPYGAHTTASDALWMGIPVITLSGRSFASRVCGSLARYAGLEELVCSRAEEYVDLAVALGTDRARLNGCKQRLAEHKAARGLFDTAKLVSALEDKFREIAASYCSQGAPQPNLTNLNTYLQIGMEFDHDAQEMLSVTDYAAYYKQRLEVQHKIKPLLADGRFWTETDILRADGMVAASVSPPAVARRKRASVRAHGTASA